MASAVYCVLFCLFMHSTSAQNVLSCPRFTEGRNDSIKLTVTKSAFSSPAPCTSPPTAVIFYFQPKNKSRTIWCTAQYTPCPNTGTSLSACHNCTCGCESDNGTTIVFGLHFTPSADERGGTFSSEVNCVNSGNKPPQTDVNCTPISFVPPATPPPNVTMAAPTTPPPNTTSASPTSPTSPGQESVLIWLLLLLLLLIPPLILIIIFCCPCGNIACHWCCCTGRCYCRCADKAGTGCCGAAWCKKEDNFISHVCYLCGYKKVKEEEEFICCSLEKCEVVPTTRSGQGDNKVDADHVATNSARNRERFSKPVQETELTKVRETSSPPSGVKETSPNGTS